MHTTVIVGKFVNKEFDIYCVCGCAKNIFRRPCYIAGNVCGEIADNEFDDYFGFDVCNRHLSFLNTAWRERIAEKLCTRNLIIILIVHVIKYI